MGWKSDLIAALEGNVGVAALVSTRIYGGDVPQTAALPRIAVHQLSSVPAYTHQGKDASDEDLIEVRCQASSYKGAETLAVAVKALMLPTLETASVQIYRQVDEQDVFEEIDAGGQTGLHTVVLTYEAMGK